MEGAQTKFRVGRRRKFVDTDEIAPVNVDVLIMHLRRAQVAMHFAIN